MDCQYLIHVASCYGKLEVSSSLKRRSVYFLLVVQYFVSFQFAIWTDGLATLLNKEVRL